MKDYKMLTFKDRIKIELLFNKGFSKKEIAKEIGCCLSTIYKELKLGAYKRLKSNLEEFISYSPEKAERIHDFNKTKRGRELKIGTDKEFAMFIEKEICENRLSPQAVLFKARDKDGNSKFKTDIRSVNTIYSYIDKGVFFSLERKHLPTKRKRKIKKKKKIVVHKKPPSGYSIEDRNKNIDIKERIEFGHFEGDTVVSCHGDKSAVLVLTERKTRFPIFVKLKRNTTAEVARAFDKLERSYGGQFYKIFKTITFDNGSEFKDYENIEKARRRKGKRFDMYYAHPLSPHERGSNENNNRFIRRWFPKGTGFSNVSQQAINKLETWVSEYPRKMFSGKSSKDLFSYELEKLGLSSERLLM